MLVFRAFQYAQVDPMIRLDFGVAQEIWAASCGGGLGEPFGPSAFLMKVSDALHRESKRRPEIVEGEIPSDYTHAGGLCTDTVVRGMVAIGMLRVLPTRAGAGARPAFGVDPFQPGDPPTEASFAALCMILDREDRG